MQFSFVVMGKFCTFRENVQSILFYENILMIYARTVREFVFEAINHFSNVCIPLWFLSIDESLLLFSRKFSFVESSEPFSQRCSTRSFATFHPKPNLIDFVKIINFLPLSFHLTPVDIKPNWVSLILWFPNQILFTVDDLWFSRGMFVPPETLVLRCF